MASNLHKLASIWIIFNRIFWRCLVAATQFLEIYSIWWNRILTIIIFLPGVWDCFLFPPLVIQFPLTSLSFPFSHRPSYLIIGWADVVVTILIVYWNENVFTHFRSHLDVRLSFDERINYLLKIHLLFIKFFYAICKDSDSSKAVLMKKKGKVPTSSYKWI